MIFFEPINSCLLCLLLQGVAIEFLRDSLIQNASLEVLWIEHNHLEVEDAIILAEVKSLSFRRQIPFDALTAAI